MGGAAVAKASGIDDAVIEPFEQYEAAAHREQAEGGARQHAPAQRLAVAAWSRRFAPVEEPVDGHHGRRAKREGLRDVARQAQAAVERAQADGSEQQGAAAAQRGYQPNQYAPAQRSRVGRGWGLRVFSHFKITRPGTRRHRWSGGCRRMASPV